MEIVLLKQGKQIVNDTKLYLFLKRLLDIVVAITGLILASPLMLIVSILIKIEDPKGPIIFKQVRVGQYPNTFKMWIVNTKLNNFFKGILTIFNWG